MVSDLHFQDVFRASFPVVCILKIHPNNDLCLYVIGARCDLACDVIAQSLWHLSRLALSGLQMSSLTTL